jgi:hypothetical protein
VAGVGTDVGAEAGMLGVVETGWLAGVVLLISTGCSLPQPEKGSSNNSINTANAANRLMLLLIGLAQMPV